MIPQRNIYTDEYQFVQQFFIFFLLLFETPLRILYQTFSMKMNCGWGHMTIREGEEKCSHYFGKRRGHLGDLS